MTDHYVELHARSAFSFLQGASVPEELAQICLELEQPAMALVDRDNVAGAPRFYMAMKKAGLKAHLGAEITCRTMGPAYVLLAESRTGYQNLCRLITSMKLRAPKGEAAASLEELEQYSRGLICLTGNATPNRREWEHLCAIYGRSNVYVELQRHFHRDEEARNRAALELARSMKLPVVAANGACYATPDSRELYDALTAVHHHTTLEQAGRLLSRNSERQLKSAAEMNALFSDLPEAIARTREISSRLQFTLADLGYEFPRYPVPPGETINSFLRKRADEGARKRFQPYTERAQSQIEKELALIEKLDLAGYFLIVWDLVEFCRNNSILVQGRGSAANSAVCYALGITAIDPVAMELLFERFLSEERGEWPDIDLDLPSGDQRERVIQYVYQRYGRLGAAMTANVITYRGRSAARDIGKVLGFDQESLDRLSSLVSRWGFIDPDETAPQKFREAGFDLEQPLVKKFLDLYVRVQDLPRHLGQHSGGMVICQGQLDSIVPLEPATMPGRVVIQWDKEDCADLGLIKVDLLGLGMMAVLEESLQLIRDNQREEVDLAHIPKDDPSVYSALQQADTVGLFQVESRAQMSCLPRLQPRNFYDIVVEVAIIRPGPIVGKMLNPYLKRRQGLEAPTCLHPSLESVLSRTLGVPLFQEQLLRMAMIVSGFTGGEAEDLRRAMGFKRSEKRMRDIETKLRHGMEARGITGSTQDEIVQSITAFALYGFPESHAASFALIAYASAYLKCHYLAAFTAGLLNNQPMGFYHPATLVKDAQRHGLHFLPVDVTKSEYKCTMEPWPGKIVEWAVRLGLNYVRGLRKETAEAIVAGRPFASIDDLALRVPSMRKDEMRMLAEIGALNSLGAAHRREALWDTEQALRPAGPLLNAIASKEPAPLAPMNPFERTHADFYGTSLTIGGHPMRLYREMLQSRGILRADELPHIPDGRWVRIAGCVICRQRPGTAKGFLFLSLEDETGISNAIVTPDMFETYRLPLVREPYLMIEGVLQNQQGAISVKARRVESLALKPATPSHDFH
jgi:error-prone DNA polymerase